MGQVELVVRRQGSFARTYARKRLLEQFADDADVREMFLEEARVAGLIRHANTVPVLDVGEDEVGPYLVMDFVAGIDVGTLVRERLRHGATVPIQVALDVARQAAEGLHAVHTARGANGQPLGLIHRDVTPSNILIGFDGCVRVTDFGVARSIDRVKRTRPGVLKGKAGYMTPEQLRFERLDSRSDLFSLGVVLYEMVAGTRLYGGGMENAAHRILREPAPDLGEARVDAPPELVDLCYRLLAKDPAVRPSSGRELARALEAIARDLEPIPLDEFLDAHFSRERASVSAMVDEALSVDPTVFTGEHPALPAQLPRARSPFAWAAVLAVVLLACVGAAFGWARLSAEPVVTPLPPAEAPLVQTAPTMEPLPQALARPVEPEVSTDPPEEATPSPISMRRERPRPTPSATDEPAPRERTPAPHPSPMSVSRMRAVWTDY